jgi:hypothetical protein
VAVRLEMVQAVGETEKQTIERYFLARASLTALHASVSVEEQVVNRKGVVR